VDELHAFQRPVPQLPRSLDPDQLNPLERRILKEAFLQGRSLQNRLALDYQV